MSYTPKFSACSFPSAQQALTFGVTHVNMRFEIKIPAFLRLASLI